MRKSLLRLLPLLAIAFVLIGCAQKQEQPNVVLILVDDLGWTDLGLMGSTLYQTPHVDRLAEKSTVFTNAYAACTVCSPTRASIMTGKYPATLNCTDWIEGHKRPHAKLAVPDWTMYLDTAEYNLAEAFKHNGYVTAHIGKWHLGESAIYWPVSQGFDSNIGGWAKGSPQLRKKQGFGGYFAPYGNPRLADKESGEYLTERLSQEACHFIETHHPDKTGQPFFLNFWLYNVHLPLQAKAYKVEKYKALVDSTQHHLNPTYAAMVEHMDDAVGAILNSLKVNGLSENTIVVFTSDNGGHAQQRKTMVTSNYPLREGKGHVYEGGVRVPMLIYNPQLEQQVNVSHQPVISNDIFPTLAAMANLQLPDKVSAGFDGLSLDGVIEVDKPLKRSALFWHYPHYHTLGATPYSAIRKGDWKLIRFFEDEHYELYNLKEDISESVNVAEQHSDKVNALKDELFLWYQQVEAQMPRPNSHYKLDSSK
ncbi:sulfatase [Carboxylicivirga mesophila]|uniref:Sulfatase n=1 Tax=Carboxylicivirga mesophila TaxID=1166478 RepID=A0ABS5KGB2_9BACT|nr:sulfatase [Carboxylicivirga mesophila]MBS2213934.1 sulfatase [Carboxylicivirga mesophila]